MFPAVVTMIPVDTNCEAGPHEVERDYRGLGGMEVEAMGRDTFLSNPNKTAIRSPPRRSTRLAASGGGFRGVKRSRRPLKLPTGRMIRAQIRIGERSRTLAGEETSSPIGTARSKVDLSSTALTTESDDAVVPR